MALWAAEAIGLLEISPLPPQTEKNNIITWHHVSLLKTAIVQEDKAQQTFIPLEKE